MAPKGCALSLAETFDSGSKWERMDASGFWSGKVGEADNEVPAWTKGGLLGKGSFGKVHLGLGITPTRPAPSALDQPLRFKHRSRALALRLQGSWRMDQR